MVPFPRFVSLHSVVSSVSLSYNLVARSHCPRRLPAARHLWETAVLYGCEINTFPAQRCNVTSGPNSNRNHYDYSAVSLQDTIDTIVHLVQQFFCKPSTGASIRRRWDCEFPLSTISRQFLLLGDHRTSHLMRAVGYIPQGKQPVFEANRSLISI